MATLTPEPHTPSRLTINVDGQIVRGDAERFQTLVEAIGRKWGHPEGPVAITAAIDSPGGDYLEGLELGNLFWRSGYGTLVRANAECYSAAATAFLGGAYLGAADGWGPNRVVEIGGLVGFHSFYSTSSDAVPMAEGIEHGKRLLMLLTGYATALRIDMRFILESLKKGPAEILMVKTAEHFRKLGITLLGTKRTSTLTEQEAVFAANYATNWQRPISLHPGAGEALAQVSELSSHKFRQLVLQSLLSRTHNRGPVSRIIESALLEDKMDQSDAIFHEMESLGAIPYLHLKNDQRVFRVSGFDFGGGFYVTDCYIIPINEGTPQLAVAAITVDTGGSIYATHYSHSGDCLYELHRPSDPLI